MTRPTYDEAFEVISMYAPKVQTLFADGWSRWPVYPVAATIAAALEDAAGFWHKDRYTDTGHDIAQRIDAVVAEIRLRLAQR